MNTASMNNGYIVQSQNISVKINSALAMASLVPRLSCVGGEPWSEATVMHDQLVTGKHTEY